MSDSTKEEISKGLVADVLAILGAGGFTVHQAELGRSVGSDTRRATIQTNDGQTIFISLLTYKKAGA